MRWLIVLALVCACKKQADPPPQEPPAPVMPAIEVKRGQDACKTYVDKLCACADTFAALMEPCVRERALADALEVNLSVAAHPESSRRDALQAQGSVRAIVKRCIEETAKLPAAGCP
jgi:hypothetical protein